MEKRMRRTGTNWHRHIGIACLFWCGTISADSDEVSSQAIEQMQLKAISMCTGFVQGVRQCTLADTPGQHLKCPAETAEDADPAAPPEECELSRSGNAAVSAEIKGLNIFGSNLAARISGSSIDRLVFKASLKNVSAIREHRHVPNGASESCPSEYIQRMDLLTAFGAAYHGSDVSISVPVNALDDDVGDFTAEIQASDVQGNAARLTNVRVCEYRPHPEPLDCVEEVEDSGVEDGGEGGEEPGSNGP